MDLLVTIILMSINTIYLQFFDALRNIFFKEHPLKMATIGGRNM